MFKLKTFIQLFSVIFLIGNYSCKSHEEIINVATYNLRYNTPKDGENAWPNRKEKIVKMVTKYDFDVLGVQEVRADQAADLAIMFPQYIYFGIGRNDGVNGEQAGLMFKRDKFSEIGKGHFWLSPTPDTPSIGWDASVNRIAVWAILKEKKTGKEFLFLATHLDHLGKTARFESAKLLKDRAISLAGNRPLFCVADYNATPEQNSIQEMKTIFLDSFEVSEAKPTGPDATLNLFDTQKPMTMRIDYIFINNKVKVKSYATLDDIIEGNYPSDHCPIMIEAILK